MVGDFVDSADCCAIDDTLPRSVRELCHDVLEAGATIGLLAQVAGPELRPDVAPESQLASQLRLIAAAANQIATICAHVLDEYHPPHPPVPEPRCDLRANSPRAARRQGGRAC
jgi:hypothetical protein